MLLYALFIDLFSRSSQETNHKQRVAKQYNEYEWDCSCIQVIPTASTVEAEGNVDVPLHAAVTEVGNLWDIGSIVTYSFMNGEIEQHRKVDDCLRVWTRDINLVLKKVQSGGDVRVQFSDSGSWSHVGKKCQKVERTRPTMQLSGIDPTKPSMTTEEIRVILHECGHMFGFVHEHQSPARRSKFTFDEQATFYYYGTSWPQAIIEKNILDVYAEEELSTYSQFDCMSIMLYYISPAVNVEGKEISQASDLSPLDKAYMLLMYPPPLPEGVQVIDEALRIANVPHSTQEEILRQTSPNRVRELFMQWNITSRTRVNASTGSTVSRLISFLKFM